MYKLIKRTVTEVFYSRFWDDNNCTVKISKIYHTVDYSLKNRGEKYVTFRIGGWNPFPIIGDFQSSTPTLFKWYADNGWTYPEHIKTIVNNTEVEY